MGSAPIEKSRSGSLKGLLSAIRSRLGGRGDQGPACETSDRYCSLDDIETVAAAFQGLVSQITREGRELTELYVDAERRAAGNALLNETIIESVGSGILVVEKGGRVRLVNSAARRLLGLGQEREPAGVKFGKLFLDGSEFEVLIEEDLRRGADSSRRLVQVVTLEGKKKRLGVSTSCVRPSSDSDAHAVIAVFTVLDDSPDRESADSEAETELQGYLRGVLDSYDLMSGLLRGFSLIEKKSAEGSLTKAELARFSSCLRSTCDTMMAFALSTEASSSLTELVEPNQVIESVLARRATTRSAVAVKELWPDPPRIKTVRKVLEKGLELLITGCVAESASGIAIITGPGTDRGPEVVEISIRELSPTRPLVELGRSLRELAGTRDCRREAGLLLLASLPREDHEIEAQRVDGLFRYSLRLRAPIQRKAGKSQQKGDTLER